MIEVYFDESLLNLVYFHLSSGKTYTMVGTQDDPGLMVLSLKTIFDLIKKDDSCDQFEVTCSYLEVYNEVHLHIHKKKKKVIQFDIYD